MTDVDARLRALLREDAPPARDSHFRLAVLERMERRHAVRKLAAVGGLGLAATALTIVLAPELSRMLAPNVLLLAGGFLGLAAGAWGVLQIQRPV